MRGSIDGLGSSAPIGVTLPAVFADDELAQRFVGGLDDVLAPILAVLDCLDSYFTPSLAPVDFTWWLAGWVGAETDGTEPDDRLRAAVAAAAYLHRIRGTGRGPVRGGTPGVRRGAGDHGERRCRLARRAPRSTDLRRVALTTRSATRWAECVS